MEVCKLLGILVSGNRTDIYKCFDQLNRELVYELARQVGMPVGILDAYRRYQESTHIYNSVVGGLGMSYRRRTGIPQGCPLSMMFVVFVLRPWALGAKQRGLHPRMLADDILLDVSGAQHLPDIVVGAKYTHQYLIDMGARIATSKSSLFSTEVASRQCLSQQTWRESEDNIAVVKSFRDLGGHINVGWGSYSTASKLRIKEAIDLIHRIAKLLVTLEMKAHLIRTKVLPKAFYGCEPASLCPKSLLNLRKATKNAIGSDTPRKSSDFTFSIGDKR